MAQTEAPFIALYPCQTAIQGVSFQGELPVVSSSSLPVRWSLLNAPDDMTINETNGLVVWPDPVQGSNFISYYISLAASNNLGADVAEYVLSVVTNDYPDLQIVSTRNIDYVVPGWFAAYFEQYQPHHVVDLAYDRMRQLAGMDLGWGKQIVKFNPDADGGAWSGQPVNFGPYRASMDPVDGWDGVVGTPLHEMAHNFHGLIGVTPGSAWSWFDPFFHHGVPILDKPVRQRTVGLGAACGLTHEALGNYAALVARRSSNSLADYAAWIAADNQAADYPWDKFGAWIGLCEDLMDKYGLTVLENTERSFRYDGIPLALRSRADTPLKTMTLLFCTMSAAAGTDLRDYFQGYGFDIDETFFAQISNQVFNAIASLPKDENIPGGWKHCSINNHYYRLTAWAMPWAEAERTARRYGGHLATVRSAAEEEWLVSRFSSVDNSINNLWIGLSDEAQEGTWQWVSGEPVTYFDWGPGEPNGGTGENYVVLNWWNTKKWNDWCRACRTRGIIEVTNITTPAYEPEVTVVAMDKYISKATSQTGQFRIVCTTNGPAVIGVEITGTAVEGVDYTPISHSVTIPAGTNEAAIVISPLAGSIPEGVEDILITITNSPWRVWPYRQAEMRLLQCSSTALTYNATAEFVLTNGNPNGVWSYGWMPIGFGEFHFLTNHFIWWGVERPAWLGANYGNPVIFKNLSQTFDSTPPGWLALVTGQDAEPVVLRWTAPRSGPITVQGDFLPGDGAISQIGILFNEGIWWDRLDSGGFLLKTNVLAGDTVDFTLYGVPGYATTPLNAVVSYITPMLHCTRTGQNTAVNFIAAGPGTYVLEFANALSPGTPWMPIRTNTLFTGQFISFTDSRDGATGFYRVRVH
ncbi:MAG: lectin-like protein [Verrucomicrobia bacterium]|nr:lectin-like protein [Verrucomicrobiota bacterium]